MMINLIDNNVKNDDYFYVWEKGKLNIYRIVSSIVNTNKSGYIPIYEFTIIDNKGKNKVISFIPDSNGIEWRLRLQRCRSFDYEKIKEFLTNTYKRYIQDKEYIIAQEKVLLRKYKNYVKSLSLS